jgi:sugar lactone lactonase YvrE
VTALAPALRTLADGLDHPECVCWSPGVGALLAGGEDGQVYRFGLDGEPVELVARVEGAFIAGLCADGDGNAYCCDIAGGQVYRVGLDGRVEAYGDPIAYPNYPVFDAAGTLWVSDSGDWERSSGAIVAIRPGGARSVMALRPLAFANGLALRDDWLYIVESARCAVVRAPLGGGSLEPVVTLPETVPDGLAFDADGGLWISCWQPNRIYRLTPDGRLDVVADDWSGTELLTPTNVAFAGAGLELLAVASLAGRAVRAFDPGVRGAPLHYPRVRA